ncbi:MAG: ABC transporter permease [Puia sp.]|nr:ABC transporter permease [Puia sp.]
MFRNLLKVAFRSLRKHRFHSGLNIFGLALGMGCSLVLFQFVRYHLGFDAYHRNAGHLYRVVTDLHLDDGSVEFERGAPLALVEALRREVPQVSNTGVLVNNHFFMVSIPEEPSVNRPGGKDETGEKIFAEHENTAFADRHWFELFDYHWEAGDAATALQAPNMAVITAGLAKKYFGEADPMGRVIRIDRKQSVTITGVVSDPPPATDFKTALFVSLSSYRNFFPDDQAFRTNWWLMTSRTSLFILLPQGVAAGSVDKAIRGLTKTNMGEMSKNYQFHLQPLKEVHFDGRYSGVISRSLLTTLGLVAIFLLLIACINFINLSSAQQARRVREIGTRKVLGSGPAAIFWQFMTETSLMVLLAAIGAVCLLAVLIQGLNNWLQLDLGFKMIGGGSAVAYFILLLLLVAAAAGLYPALMLSRVRPIAALKTASGNMPGSSRPSWQRKGLIILQNGCAQVLIVCALVITMQMNYIRNADLGFKKDAVVMLRVPDTSAYKMAVLREQLLARPGVKELSFCFRAPSSDANNGGSVRFDDRDWEKFVARSIEGDSHYVPTFGLRLLAGRNLQESDTIREFLINEDLVHKLGFRDPGQVIGHRLVAGDVAGDHPGVIVGVVGDFNYSSLYGGIEPVEISTVRENYKYAAIKLNGVSAGGGQVLKEVDAIWRSVYPGNVFEYHFLNEQIEGFYRSEETLNRMIGVAAVVAIVISCLGLLGLVSMLTLQRTKEIGIRKVSGASEGQILVLLAKDFLQWVLLSILIAVPVAGWAMHQWLQRFNYRIPFPGWLFGLSGVGGVIIALFTIGFHATRAARANPVEALRRE